MTERATLEALLARVLEGEEPDQELDAEIAVGLFGGEIIWKTANYIMEQYPVRRIQNSDYVGGYQTVGVLGYTASLDAALTLIPDGWRINLLSEWDNETLRAKGAWQAILIPIGKGDSIHAGMRTRCDHAATPPRALMAACIKAMMEAQSE